MASVIVERAYDLVFSELDEVLAESTAEGFAFVRRLIEDWKTGVNRFDGPREALLLARRESAVIGICGLNVDPFARDPAVGRLRHLYVSAARRRQGIGRRLVARIVAIAAKSFTCLALRTNSAEAAAFYTALGFVTTDRLPESTHCLDLGCRSSKVLQSFAGPD